MLSPQNCTVTQMLCCNRSSKLFFSPYSAIPEHYISFCFSGEILIVVSRLLKASIKIHLEFQLRIISFLKKLLRKSHQKRFVRVVCEGLRDSWTSRLPGTAVKTDVTVGMVGFVKSVKVVGVLDGLMEALDISEAGPEGVPAWSVESEVLSTPVFSWRKRFRLNLARAFWNQTWNSLI